MRASIRTAVDLDWTPLFAAMLHRRHDVAVRQGQHPPPLDDPERLPQLASAVGELHDPASIPALAAALGTGFAVIRPLAAFGERAVSAVLSVEASPESSTGSIDHALLTLRFIVEGASERGGLSEATRADLRGVAARRLTSSGSPTTLGGRSIWRGPFKTRNFDIPSRCSPLIPAQSPQEGSPIRA
jgi:hypothetical protein